MSAVSEATGTERTHPAHTSYLRSESLTIWR